MPPRNKQSGFITLIFVLAVVLMAVIFVAYKTVSQAQQ